MKLHIYLIVFSFIQFIQAQELINLAVAPRDSFSTKFYDVCEREDGYFAVGSLFNANGRSIISLVRIKYDGSIVWKKEFLKEGPNPIGLPYNWYSAKISKTLDGGCYILGKETSYLGGGITDYKGLLLKVSANGDLDWSRYHSILADQYTDCDLITTQNGEAVAVGPDIGAVGTAIKMDGQGNVLFSKVFQTLNDYRLSLNSLAETKDGSLILTGVYQEVSAKERAVLIKIDQLGKELWRKYYFSGDWESGDSIKAYPLSLALGEQNEIIVAGQLKKYGIANSQGFVFKCDPNGAILWNEIPFESSYPGFINSNAITKVFYLNGHLMYNFREGSFNLFGIDLQFHKSHDEILQAGYEFFPSYHYRRFELMNQFGQPVFIGGGQLSFGDVDRGLLLTATPEGLFIPPTLVSIEQNTLYPWLVSHSRPHIRVHRVVQIAKSDNFNEILFEKDVFADSVQLDLKNLIRGRHYLRLGTVGPLNNVIFNQAIEFDFSNPLNFATRVIAVSSEYSNTSWSAYQALYAPNVYPSYGDNGKAWASETADGKREYLHLGFDNNSRIKAVIIYETFNSGAVDTIYAKNPNTGEWVILYQGAARAMQPVAREWRVDFSSTDFPVNEIRLAIHSQAVPGWNEIDAVAIVPTGPTNNENPTVHTKLLDKFYSSGDNLILHFTKPTSENMTLNVCDLEGKLIYTTDIPEQTLQFSTTFVSQIHHAFILNLNGNKISYSQLFIK